MDAPAVTPLRQLRLAAGLSLREIARRSGLTPWRLSLIERGVPPTAEERAKILRTLIPPDEEATA